MRLPLAGIRVVEFSHMVMGPSCGLILGDLGADVIKVEPVGEGDNTRRLPGSGAGFFAAFNRNKQSLALDIKAPKGLAFAKKLIARSDALIENFRPGGLDAAGAGLRRAQHRQSGPDLLLAQGLPRRSLRASPRARRNRADDGRARLHDRAAGTAAARGRFGQRHHGRHVRRHRHHGRADGACAYRPRPAHPQRAVREQRVPGLAAHGAVRRHRQAGRADAGAHLVVGHLRRVRHRRRRARSSSPASPIRSGGRSARRSACPTLRPTRRSPPICCASPRASGCCRG